jgi:hypothetical protein
VKNSSPKSGGGDENAERRRCKFTDDGFGRDPAQKKARELIVPVKLQAAGARTVTAFR